MFIDKFLIDNFNKNRKAVIDYMISVGILHNNISIYNLYNILKQFGFNVSNDLVRYFDLYLYDPDLTLHDYYRLPNPTLPENDVRTTHYKIYFNKWFTERFTIFKNRYYRLFLMDIINTKIVNNMFKTLRFDEKYNIFEPRLLDLIVEFNDNNTYNICNLYNKLKIINKKIYSDNIMYNIYVKPTNNMYKDDWYKLFDMLIQDERKLKWYLPEFTLCDYDL